MGDGIVGSDYLGVAARPGEEDEAARAIARALAESERDLAFDGLWDGDPLARALADEDAPIWRLPLLPCPHLALDRTGAAGYAAWLDGLPAGKGAQIRRRRRWLERRPGFRIDVARGEAEVAAALAVLWRLHEARWTRAGGSDAVDGPRVLAFHDEAARALA